MTLCAYLHRVRAGDKSAVDARHQRIRAQAVGAVDRVVAFAGRRTGPRCWCAARSPPTGRPWCSACRGRSSSARRADRRPQTSRRFRGCLPACGRASCGRCASGRDRPSAGRRCRGRARRPPCEWRGSRRRAAPGCRTWDTTLPGSTSARFRECSWDRACRPAVCGTQTRPPSPRADSDIRRSLSSPGIDVGCTWMNSPLA